MYVLANDEGSPRLGSIFARRVNSVIEVFKTDKLRAEDILDANDTLVKTEVRNSDVCEVMTGFTVDVDDGIKAAAAATTAASTTPRHGDACSYTGAGRGRDRGQTQAPHRKGGCVSI